MHRTLITISSLLLSIAILLLGSGLLGTLLSLRASVEGYSGTTIGLIVTLYFLGFIVGPFVCPRLIRRAGHIRSFAVAAALGSCTVLIYGLWVAPAVWMVTRFITGVCLVGIYMIIESWLNAQASNTIRGRIFAAYMLVNLFFLALGQFLILAGDIADLRLFAISAILFSLGLVPVAMTRLPEPVPITEVRLDLRKLYRTVPSGFMGSLIAGLLGSAFWGLGPLFALHAGLSREGIAAFMSAGILGGAVLQLPIGLLSDRHDRRRVLFDISLLGSIVAVIALLVPTTSPLWPALVMFFYGGMMFSIYPVSAALTNDFSEPTENVETSGNLLMVYGIGAMTGPIIAGPLMQWFGRGSLFVFFAVSGLVLAIFIQYQSWRHPKEIPPEEKAHFVPMTRTTQVAIESIAETATETPQRDEDAA
jgi:MFS family permease